MAQAQFKGKIAVVTGAASGLGLAIAERLAAYLCGDSAGVITGAALTMDLGWTAR